LRGAKTAPQITAGAMVNRKVKDKKPKWMDNTWVLCHLPGASLFSCVKMSFFFWYNPCLQWLADCLPGWPVMMTFNVAFTLRAAVREKICISFIMWLSDSGTRSCCRRQISWKCGGGVFFVRNNLRLFVCTLT